MTRVPRAGRSREESSDAMAVWTVGRVLAWTVDRFQRADVDAPRLAAELLLARAMGARRIDLYTGHERELTKAERVTMRAIVERRLSGEPTAYILGEREFWSLALEVTPDTLVPRPETETLVEAVLARVRGDSRDAPLEQSDRSVRPHRRPEQSLHCESRNSVVGELQAATQAMPARPVTVWDVGTGSGAIAIALMRERQTWRAVASDASRAALAVAKRNAVRHGVAERISFVAGDGLACGRPARRLDAVVANLPYIPTATVETLAREVRDFEPRIALDGGDDGLALIRVIVGRAPDCLVVGGLLALEVDNGQADAVEALLCATGRYAAVERLCDLARSERVVVARAR